ncbi:hypothetical protein HCA63_16940 [Listeria booriae]|uniref:hypothetical protein n=1 Tax=Listeria booriae TaxID=1552123 RepID=UPI0016284BB0|nr:hypothetical protein [Listeria booriae]MBC1890045.1 hypothetical protein [Listeria booriae]
MSGSKQYNNMKKWRGFFLSQHIEQLEKMEDDWKEVMSQELVYQVLNSAIQNRSILAIQLYSSNMSPDPYIVGRISGVEGDLLHVQTVEGIQVVELEEIRYVEERTFQKWYEN